MVEHLVWFKLVESATEADKDAMMDGLRALPVEIEGIETLTCGRDFSGRSRGFEIGLTVRFASRSALEIYATHPAHLRFLGQFKPLWSEVMALDYEA